MYSIEEFDKQKTKILKYIMYKKRTENEIRIKFNTIDEDLLEDVLIENKQAMEMSKIYSDILSGVMDAYSSIISNNLNGVMKILTAITIIISVPTMISSFWGMNVKVPMQDNPWGFAIILIASILIGIIVTIILKRKDYLN